MWLVLMRIGPSCPNAHSRLTMSLSSADWAVYRHLHFLPTVCIWFGCISLGAWWDLLVCIYTHIVTSNYHKHVCIGGILMYVF
jgi:hypothetical protein